MHRRTHRVTEVAEPGVLSRCLSRMGGRGGRLGHGIADASPRMPMPDAAVICARMPPAAPGCARASGTTIRVACAPTRIGTSLATVIPTLAAGAATIPAAATPATFRVRDRDSRAERHRKVRHPRDDDDR
jgi:hypothetical protein